MNYAIKIDGIWQQIYGSFVVSDVQYPANWIDNATVAEREELGVYPIEEAAPIPENVKFKGTELVDRNDLPVFENLIEEYTPIEAYEIMWAKAKAIRESEILLGAPTPIGIVNADLEAKVNILGVGLTWAICHIAGIPFPGIDFTMADNKPVNITDSAAPGFALASGSFIGKIHANSQAIRNALKAALANGSSAKTIFQIDITTGYPSDA